MPTLPSSTTSKSNDDRSVAAAGVRAGLRTEPGEQHLPSEAIAAVSIASGAKDVPSVSTASGARAVQHVTVTETAQAGQSKGVVKCEDDVSTSKAAPAGEPQMPIKVPWSEPYNAASGFSDGQEADPEVVGPGDVKEEGAAVFDNPYKALMELGDEIAAHMPDASASTCPPAARPGRQHLSVSEAAQEALQVLCNGSLIEVAGQSRSSSSSLAGSRLVPRGLVNTGNSCFINSILQAMMASGSFCAVLIRLRNALPLIQAVHYPALHGLGSLACEFKDVLSESTSSEASGAGEVTGIVPPAGAADGSLPALVVGMEGAVGWNEVGPKSKRKYGKTPHSSLPSDSNSMPAAPQTSWPTPASAAAAAVQSSAVLGGKPLVPVMLSDVLRGFSPRQAAAAVAAVKDGATAGCFPASTGAAAVGPPAELSLAQRLRIGPAGGHGQEQEDAQVTSTHYALKRRPCIRLESMFKIMHRIRNVAIAACQLKQYLISLVR
jgi:hypothetical protein